MPKAAAVSSVCRDEELVWGWDEVHDTGLVASQVKALPVTASSGVVTAQTVRVLPGHSDIQMCAARSSLCKYCVLFVEVLVKASAAILGQRRIIKM